jgi:hypothetical protein
MNVDLSMSRMQREMIKSKRAQGQARWPRSGAGHTSSPKILGIFPKFPCKSLNLVEKDSEAWLEAAMTAVLW